MSSKLEELARRLEVLGSEAHQMLAKGEYHRVPEWANDVCRFSEDAMAALRESELAVRVLQDTNDKLGKALAGTENARLRAAIEKAPCDDMGRASYGESALCGDCSCWKHEAPK